MRVKATFPRSYDRKDPVSVLRMLTIWQRRMLACIHLCMPVHVTGPVLLLSKFEFCGEAAKGRLAVLAGKSALFFSAGRVELKAVRKLGGGEVTTCTKWHEGEHDPHRCLGKPCFWSYKSLKVSFCGSAPSFHRHVV